MKRTEFRPYNLNSASRKVLSVGAFGGVDLTSPKMLASNNRSIDMLNYLYKDNGNYLRKRNGYQQLKLRPYGTRYRYADTPSSSEYVPMNYKADGKVHNIWKTTFEDGKEHIIIQKGNKIYIVNELTTAKDQEVVINLVPLKVISNGTTKYVTIPRLEDRKYYGLVNNRKLWLLTGTNYMVVSVLGDNDYRIEYVSDSEYVQTPTTTTTITAMGTIATGKRTSLDEVNLLSRWRYNKLISGIPFADNYNITSYWRYDLDGKLALKDNDIKEINKIELVIDTLKKDGRTNKVTTRVVTFKGIRFRQSEAIPVDQVPMTMAMSVTQTNTSNGTIIRLPSVNMGTGGNSGTIENSSLEDTIIFVDERYPSDCETVALQYKPTTTTNENGDLVLIDYSSIAPTWIGELPIVGYIEENPNANNSLLIMNRDYENPYGTDNNMTLKFPVYDSDNEEKINKCRFGIMFGNKNSASRFFVSGNETMREYDWHTSEVTYRDTEKNYPTYFGDLGWQRYGDTDNGVVAYDIVSTDRLLVLKNYSDKEKSVYFRIPTLEMVVNETGGAAVLPNGSVAYSEQYPVEMGNNSIAGVRWDLITNLNGDTLFISSENNVMGLDLQGIVGDNQRYGSSRSYYIDEYLKKVDMSKANIWNNNNEMYLMLEDKIFCTTRTLRGEDNQYEWFIIDLKNVRAIMEHNGRKYYMRDNGEMLMETPNEYEDVDITYLPSAVINLQMNGGNISIVKTSIFDGIDYSQNNYLKYIGNSNIGIYLGALVRNHNDNQLLEHPTYFCYDTEKQAFKVSTPHDIIEVAIEKDMSFFLSGNSKTYRMEKIPSEDMFTYYRLIDRETNEIYVEHSYGTRLCLKLNGEKIDIIGEVLGYDKETTYLNLRYFDKEFFNLGNYDTGTQIADIYLEHRKPVEAYLISKPFTFGSTTYLKTIWQWSLVNDTNLPSELELTITTNKIPYNKSKTLVGLSDGAMSLDFNNLRFDRIDFERNLTPRTYTYTRIIDSLDYLCLGIRSRSNSDSVISSVNIVYSYSLPSYK